MALAHHDAALDHQRRGGEAELVGAQHGANDHVPAGLHLAVGLHCDAATQPVEHQRLLRLREAQFPGRAGMLDRGDRRRTGAAVVAGNDHVIGLGLGDPGCHRAHAHFGHQLDADAGARIGVLQVVDELRQVLDRVDVVVRRGADEAHPGHREAQLGDVLADLVAGQLTAFARLGALRHLDLNLVGADQVFRSDAEPAGGHLLDLAAQRVAFLQRYVAGDPVLAQHAGQRVALPDGDAAQLLRVAPLVLAAFAGIALAADAVHRNRQRRVGLGGNGAQRHRAGGKALDDLPGGLDLVQRNRLPGVDLELEQPPQRHVAPALVVDDLRVFLVGLVGVGAAGVLQLGDGVRRPHVLFAAYAPGVFAAGVEHRGQQRVVGEGGPMSADRLFHDLEQADSADVARGAAEVLVHQPACQTHRLEDLRTAVTHVGADAHLRHDLVQALADRLDVVLDGFVAIDAARLALVHRRQRFHREVRMDRLGTIAGQQRKVMDLACRAGLHHQAGGGAQPRRNQVLVHRAGSQQRRDRDVPGVDPAVRQHQDVVATAHRIDRLRAERGQACFDALLAPRKRVADVDLEALELARGKALDVADLVHVLEVEHGLAHFQTHRRVDVVDVEQVGLRADKAHQRHDELLADRVDGRIGHLREQLLEVAVQRLVAVRQHGQRAVVAHRAGGFLAVAGHRRHQDLQVLLRVAEGLLPVQQIDVGARRRRGLGLGRQVVEADTDALDPLLVRVALGELLLELAVVDDAALLGVDQEHLAGLQAPLLGDAALGDRQHADLGGHDHQVVVGHDVARRPQPVAVERGADPHTVGEGNSRRAVPWLHHGRVVLVESAAVLVHQRVLLPGFGDHHHHRVGQRVARHRQQFQAVVEAGRVRLSFVNERPELAEVFLEHWRGHHALARTHPVEVALDRIDLAVVRDHPVRVRQFPRRERVGRKALMHQRDGADHARVAQVLVVAADLVGQQEPLVDDRARRHRRHEVLLAVLQPQRLDLVAGGLADDVQLALERIGDHHVGAAADEDLPDHRLALAHQRRHRHFAVHRHVAPPQNHLPLGAHGALEFLLAGQPRGMLARQEDHADSVFALGRQHHALAGELFPEIRIRDLNQDAGAIAAQRVRTDRPPVIEVMQDQQRLLDQRMARLALDVRHETHPAGVVLGRRAIKPALFGVFERQQGHRGGSRTNDPSLRSHHRIYCGATAAATRKIGV